MKHSLRTALVALPAVPAVASAQPAEWRITPYAWGSLVGGWRCLHIDHEKSGFKIDGALSGPFIGASFQL